MKETNNSQAVGGFVGAIVGVIEYSIVLDLTICWEYAATSSKLPLIIGIEIGTLVPKRLKEEADPMELNPSELISHRQCVLFEL